MNSSQLKEFKTDKSFNFNSLSFSTKDIKKGALYFCLKGSKVDGHNFAELAVKKGASGLVVERKLPIDIPQIIVPDTRKALSEISSLFYGGPKNSLKFIGITGTNGKTTTSFIIKSILEAGGKKVGVIGTQGIYIQNKHIKSDMTTPDPIEFHSTLRKMVDAGIEYVVMEVSAHAIALSKVENITYDVAVLTNITKDHLDFFKTMQAYADTKMQFVTSKFAKLAIVNMDDNLIAENLNKIDIPVISYGLNCPADAFAVNIINSLNGTKCVLNIADNVINVQTKLVGEFNIYNVLAGASACMALGSSEKAVKSGLKALESPCGRFNVMPLNKDITAIIDFAHTPDGMAKVLGTIRQVSNKKLVCIFGCGGNRDTTKRGQMGRIAEELSDFVIVTSDNPRYENPEDIINEIESGMQKQNHIKITDRKEAIKTGLKYVSGGGVLAILGKGGELYQDIAGQKLPYNDFEEVEKLDIQ